MRPGKRKKLDKDVKVSGCPFVSKVSGCPFVLLVIDQVVADADYTVIARRDAPDAVVMSLDTFNGLMETVHLLKSPANALHLARSIAQYRQGQVSQRDLIDAD